MGAIQDTLKFILTKRVYMAPSNEKVKLGVVYHDPYGRDDLIDLVKDHENLTYELRFLKDFTEVDTALILHPVDDDVLECIEVPPKDVFIIYFLRPSAITVVCVGKGLTNLNGIMDSLDEKIFKGSETDGKEKESE